MDKQTNNTKDNYNGNIKLAANGVNGVRKNSCDKTDANKKRTFPKEDSDARATLLSDKGEEKTVTIEHGFTPEAIARLDEDEFWTDEEEERDEKAHLEAKKSNLVGKVVVTAQQAFTQIYVWLKVWTGGYLVTTVCLIGYIIYFSLAMIYEKLSGEASIRLCVCTVMGVIIFSRHHLWRGTTRLARKMYGSHELSTAHRERLNCIRFFVRWGLYGLMLGTTAWTLVSQGMKNPTNMRAVPGLFLFCVLCLLISSNPAKINWHTIFWGVGLQFLFALIILKFDVGKEAILWIQSRVDQFFKNAEEASIMMFGETYRDHYMIFGALPLILISNATLTLLYYTGAMVLLIKCIGTVLAFVLDTSPVESMSVAAGIFLEGITAILCLRPYLAKMSKSQLFLVITSAFASLGGAYLAILSSMGVPLTFLIPAMVVSAPATFAVCKLIVPETKVKKGGAMSSEVDIGSEERGKYKGALDAAQTGALNMVPLITNIVVVVFVFITYISWLNHTLVWFGERVGVQGFSIEMLSAYIFYPVALAMGIEPNDCFRSGMLLGYRLAITNLVAFLKLSEMHQNRDVYLEYMQATNGTGPVIHQYTDIILQNWNQTLKSGFISVRSEAVVTYSLCGFSSGMTVMIMMGIMATLLPRRKSWIMRMSVPALIAGNIANCMTGCFAAIFHESY
ncbi:hypothetical protein RRG08_045758 [Elysia crispata]|uniref:Uncharacterized protein n=1 Tax=Elysia crispata TaxID=231223 RepID=A0AAE1DC12_9GAST|nr:hypothetical protein RRG08_045758 [Elysia crispata]